MKVPNARRDIKAKVYVARHNLGSRKEKLQKLVVFYCRNLYRN